MPASPGQGLESTSQSEIIKGILRQLRRHATAVTSLQASSVIPGYNEWTLTASGAQTKTLSNTPVTNSSHVYLNGVEQLEGTDYSRSGTTLSVLAAMGALGGDVLEVRYLYAAGVSTTQNAGPFADTFNRTDSLTTINPASDGNNWIIYSGTWGINSSQGVRTASAGCLAPFCLNSSGPGGFRTSRWIGAEIGGPAQTLQVDLVNDNGAASFDLYLNFDKTTGAAYFIDITGSSASFHRATDFTTETSLGSVPLSSWNGIGHVLGSGITTIKLHHDGAGHLQVWQDVGTGLVSKATFTDGSPLTTGTEILLAVNAGAGLGSDPGFDNYSASAS